MLVSSANSMNFNNLVELEISLIYKINNNGPRILVKDKHNSEKRCCKNLIFKLETTECEDVLSIFRFYSKIIIRTEYKVLPCVFILNLQLESVKTKILVKQNKFFGGFYTSI